MTPAKNEEKYIENTLKSVVNQTVLPLKWIIVNDGSTDRTMEIIKKYAEENSYITLVNREKKVNRNFGSKAHALAEAFVLLKELNYDFIGSLDADVSFENEYFEKLIALFNRCEKLGIIGGIIKELVNGHYVLQNISPDSVAGAVQFFRSECYTKIGGYKSLRLGGIDAAAEIIAKQYGWKVKTIQDLHVIHHRRVANSGGNILKARFKQGMMFYSLGYHPLFFFVRSICRIKDKPFFLGTIMQLFGFIKGITTVKTVLPIDTVEFLRNEQLKKLKRFRFNFKSV
jgi:glycosyltransferase involved in cell wall biosynthesis